MIDNIKFFALHRNAIRLFYKNQYILNVTSKTTKTEVKRWIETVFGVKILGINSKRQPSKKKYIKRRVGYPLRYKRMIIKLNSNDFIPFFHK